MKFALSLVALPLTLSAKVMAASANLTPSAFVEGAYSTEVVSGWTEWAGDVSY